MLFNNSQNIFILWEDRVQKLLAEEAKPKNVYLQYVISSTATRSSVLLGIQRASEEKLFRLMQETRKFSVPTSLLYTSNPTDPHMSLGHVSDP
jgi:hypothetical protein